MSFISKSEAVTPVTETLTITAPTGLTDGRVMVAALCSDSPIQSLTVPTGFTAVTGSPSSTTVDGQTVFVYTKVCSSESGDYAFTAPAADVRTVIGGIYVFDNQDASPPHRVVTASNNSSNASPWTGTTGSFGAGNTTGQCDVIFVMGSDVLSNVDVTHAAPSGYTLQSDIRNGFRNLGVSTKDAVASGFDGVLSGTGTAGGASAGWIVFTIALLNVSGGGASQWGAQLSNTWNRIVQV
jgi:hypothetical protein